MALGAVLFDCDGVLVDSEIVGLEDSAEFLRSKGFSWSPEDLIRLFTGKRDDRFKAELLDAYAGLLGRAPSTEEANCLYEGLIEARRANRHKMLPVTGAVEMMAAVAAAGVPRAVASSSQQVHLDSKIDRFGFRPYVGEHVYSAQYVEHGKPAPDIFLSAAERLGVAPDSCIVIEDSPFGVEAGVAAGMQVWGFIGGGHCLEGHAKRLLAAGALRIHVSHFALQQELFSVIKEH
ncbi:MAG: HAD-IA family hydrolase [Parvularculaceae bacterium]|nr:HAD-IA family hydrolase [Parvularculaceae bacterium]